MIDDTWSDNQPLSDLSNTIPWLDLISFSLWFNPISSSLWSDLINYFELTSLILFDCSYLNLPKEGGERRLHHIIENVIDKAQTSREIHKDFISLYFW